MRRVRRADDLTGRMHSDLGGDSHWARGLIASHPFAEICRELRAIAACAHYDDGCGLMKTHFLYLAVAASLVSDAAADPLSGAKSVTVPAPPAACYGSGWEFGFFGAAILPSHNHSGYSDALGGGVTSEYFSLLNNSLPHRGGGRLSPQPNTQPKQQPCPPKT